MGKLTDNKGIIFTMGVLQTLICGLNSTFIGISFCGCTASVFYSNEMSLCFIMFSFLVANERKTVPEPVRRTEGNKVFFRKK